MSVADPIASPVATPAAIDDDLPARSPSALSIMMRDRRAYFGLIFLCILLTAAVFAPWITPYDPNAMDFMMLEGPSWAHPLGIDDLGRDLLSRIIHGARVSIFVGVSTVTIAGVLGVAMGIAAGFYRGWADTIIMRYIDLQWAFPNILIEGILNRDYPVVQGAILVVSFIFVFVNLLVDVLYVVIDPRIRVN